MQEAVRRTSIISTKSEELKIMMNRNFDPDNSLYDRESDENFAEEDMVSHDDEDDEVDEDVIS